MMPARHRPPITIDALTSPSVTRPFLSLYSLALLAVSADHGRGSNQWVPWIIHYSGRIQN